MTSSSPQFRFLSDDEFGGLDHDAKGAYLKEAFTRAVAEQRASAQKKQAREDDNADEAAA